MRRSFIRSLDWSTDIQFSNMFGKLERMTPWTPWRYDLQILKSLSCGVLFDMLTLEPFMKSSTPRYLLTTGGYYAKLVILSYIFYRILTLLFNIKDLRKLTVKAGNFLLLNILYLNWRMLKGRNVNKWHILGSKRLPAFTASLLVCYTYIIYIHIYIYSFVGHFRYVIA